MLLRSGHWRLAKRVSLLEYCGKLAFVPLNLLFPLNFVISTKEQAGMHKEKLGKCLLDFI